MSSSTEESFGLTTVDDVESQVISHQDDRHAGRLRKALERLHKSPPLPLTVPLGIHYTLVTLALIATAKNPWVPSYFFSHIVVILAGVWAARDLQKVQPVFFYMYVLLVSCVIDSIQLGSYLLPFDDMTKGQHATHRGLWVLSVSVIIIHLLLKPLLAVYSFVVVLQRCPNLFSCCSWCKSGKK